MRKMSFSNIHDNKICNKMFFPIYDDMGRNKTWNKNVQFLLKYSLIGMTIISLYTAKNISFTVIHFKNKCRKTNFYN